MTPLQNLSICSIVAKNYLPLAFALGNSIKKYHPNASFRILLADSCDEALPSIDNLPHKVYTLDCLSLTNLQIKELSFKYNVTEFCTAVKPFFIDFLFRQGAEKVIYFDPDVYLFSPIGDIFDELTLKSIVVTPHFFTPEIEYTGTITESLLLHAGIFNFGFIGVKNDFDGNSFIQWWRSRLLNKCYQDKTEAFHTDQKWGDLIPTFWTDRVLISKDLGRNVAFWNLHERKLETKNGKYIVTNRIHPQLNTELKFFHFAGYAFENPKQLIHKHNPIYTFKEFPELINLFNYYKEELIQAGYHQYIGMKYEFSYFSDRKTPILPYHRRLYRKLISEEQFFENPFTTDPGNTFYNLLKKNHLIESANDGTDKLNETNYKDFDHKVYYLNKIMICLRFLLGTSKYFLLLKFCQRYFRTENQTFLIKEVAKRYKFINENREDILK